MHETGLGKSLERQEKEKTRAWFTQKEQRGRRPRLNLVAWRCRASPVSLGCKTPAPRKKSRSTWPEEHHLTTEKQSKPQRRVWSDERSCCACCFPWACRLRVLLILLLLHFLLHLPAPRSLAAGELAGPSPQQVQRGAPDKRGLGFSSSPRGPQSGGGGGGSSSDRAQLNQTLQHPHSPAAPTHRETGWGCCCTGTTLKKNREVGAL